MNGENDQPETNEPQIDETPTEQPAEIVETNETGETSDPVETA